MNFFRIGLPTLLSLISLAAFTKPLPSPSNQQIILLTDIAGLTATRMPDHAVIISWTTEKEGKDDYYEIQRSTDGKEWMTIAVALAGTGIEDNSYEYIDKKAATASLYYRIRQRDGDSKYSISVVTAVEGETRAVASIFFADNTLNIRLYGQVKEGLDITILDAGGNTLLQKKYNDTGTILRFSVADLAKGRYTLNVRDAVGPIGTKKFVIR